MKILKTWEKRFISFNLTEILVRQFYNVRDFIIKNSIYSWSLLDQCSEDIIEKFEVFNLVSGISYPVAEIV